ncbi:N-formylglutamate amidohydrolase [Flavobacterium gillisiae]|uniref:N-formylglutamate amidohydrolase n=1 Tax=Flavobacterium gillisiae TaxID=150146 RepID=A0A1H4C6Z6_9FLAO|nr:N-formylglutamate amidohydrolase [Flavobacterium gillisiae]SEA56119.1 N-formylglutamate amidohydrolase [Flavobacterium gillisiae]
MKKLILHIPHSSTAIPSLQGYVVSTEIINTEIVRLTDWYTDEIFSNTTDISIIAPFSRIFCDPERFTDDSQEEMAKFGMGVLYETLDNGDVMREVTPQIRDYALENFYYPHHNKLNKAVIEELKQSETSIVVDCHSFPSIPLKRALSQDIDTPDYNIGTDNFHTPQKLIDFSQKYFEGLGYSLGIDTPYSGALVPMEHYQKNKNVQAIMLEINRRLYLNEPYNEKSQGFENTKKVVQGFLEGIRKL